ncbi:pentatricopeptide repeat-containing protein At2g13600-like [Diospyros lotus]|uniref:pentatricopeptide repeat-containing protein At2g13600-like n=1 Tax=Diospyros lotus TaxID=55363 RepID=UPI00224F7442|nr:pentatricopeptide repeat-containing protein At2g13600-like [Diospyros lotus]
MGEVGASRILRIRTLPTSAAATATLSRGLLYFLLWGSRSICSSAKSSVDHCSLLLRRCAEASSLRNGKAVHAKLIRADAPPTLFLHNHLLNAYIKCGDILSAIQLFDEMPDKNVVSWTLVIMGYFQHGCPEDALSQFNRMRGEGVKPNEFTLSCALQLCSFSQASCLASQQIYSLIVRSGFESNVFLLNAFLAALIRHGKLADASEAFDECLYKDTVSWNTMMAGYLQLSNSELPGLWCRMNQEGVKPDNFTFASVLTGLAALSELKLGVQVHARLVKSGHGSEMCVGNSLVDMYLKNQSYNDGYRTFEEIPSKDVWSWTQMATGCINCGKPMEALEVIGEMRKIGMKPNKFTLATALNACASLASLQEGEKVHGWRIKLGDDIDICVDNALLDMYVKCGCMNGALAIFRSMDDRSVVTWTSMIMGYAQNGYAEKALEIFEEMTLEGTQPNYVTFISVLYACSQGGFVDEGLKYFCSMTQDYGLLPGEDHYACMVDLLGRAGRVTEAEELILRMPFQAGLLVWKTLLGACWVHGDTVTAFRAAKHALDLDNKDPLTYVLVSNTLAGLSNWDGVGSMRKLMEARDLKKMPASSWIEVDRDRSHAAVADG